MNDLLTAVVSQPDRSFGFTVTVVIAFIGIVLGTLAFLVLLFSLFGKAVRYTQENVRRKRTQEPPQPSQHVGVPEPLLIPGAEAPEAAGVSPEVVAAISAAVMMLEGEEATVTSIRRQPVSAPLRSAWAQAAVIDNTKPF